MLEADYGIEKMSPISKLLKVFLFCFCCFFFFDFDINKRKEKK
jgi:hypothetical protein